jgi:hypothetical protein
MRRSPPIRLKSPAAYTRVRVTASRSMPANSLGRDRFGLGFHAVAVAVRASSAARSRRFGPPIAVNMPPT